MRKCQQVLFLLSFAVSVQAQQFVNGQAARAAFGQTNFTQAGATSSQLVLGGVSGLAYANGQLFVADSNRLAAIPGNNRVMVFNTSQIPSARADLTADPNLTNVDCYLCGFPAVLSLGQPTFDPPDTSVTPPVFDPGIGNDPSKPNLNNATAVATDGHMLAVADTDNNRVLLWTTMPTSMNQPANLVLGQPDFNTQQAQTSGVTNATSMRGPQGVWIQNNKLFVADTQNYRVLIWNSIPTQNNQAPDLVLGQPNFTSLLAPPAGEPNPTAAANRLLNPVSVTSDGTHLFVSDLGFNRVLIWNTIPTTMDQNADVVIGQPDMTSGVSNYSFIAPPGVTYDADGNPVGLTPSLCQSNGTDSDGTATFPAFCEKTLSFPRYALSDGTRLFLADGGNDRVLIYNTIPTANGAAADLVLGSPNFTTDTASSESISIASTAIDNTAAVDTTPTPTSLAYDGTNLYVADPYNRRVLVFTPGDTLLPDNSVVNWASEIIRQEGIVVLTGTIVASDTVTITIQSTDYTYTVKSTDTLDSIAQELVKLINASDPNATASFAGAGSGTVYLSSIGTNLGYDTITLSATSSNTADITPTASGAYLSAGTAATGAAGMLVEINAPAGSNFTDSTATLTAPLTGMLPNSLGGVQVYMDGYTAPLLKVGPTQVVAQVPYFFRDRNSTSIYVRSVRSGGNVTVTNATPLYIADANPGIFNAPGYPNQPRPWPATMAYHQSGNPTAVVSIDGSVAAKDTATITINGTNYTYTVVSTDTLDTITSNLINAINNAPDPYVTASMGGAFDRIILTARQSGAAGTGITVAGSASSGASVTVTAYSAATCCDVTPGSLITAANPAGLGELITVNAAGLGIIDDPTGVSVQSLVTGQPYTGPQPNSAINFVAATMGGSTAQVISAGFGTGSYGIYQVQMVVPTGLTANSATPLYIAQNAFISNTVTIAVGTPVPNAPPAGPTPTVSSILLDTDYPSAASDTLSGTVGISGWAIDADATIASVTTMVDGVAYGTAVYGASRPDVCAVHANSPGCPNVGWMASLDTTVFSDGGHTLQVTATDANGLHYTSATPFTVSNNTAAGPTRIFIDVPGSGFSYHGVVKFSGWAVNDNAAITGVTVLIDGVSRGSATYGLSRPDVCQVFPGRGGCPNVGWSYDIDTNALANGAHTIVVSATAANGQHSVVSGAFAVSNWAGTNPGLITIDVPGPSSAAFSGTATISGWAIDSQAAIGSVSVAVDGIVLGNAGYGGNRSDVCAVYANYPGCPNVGWIATIDTTQFADGTHTLAITANPVSGQSFTISAPFVIANLTGSANALAIGTDVPNASSGPLAGMASVSGWAVGANAAITRVQVLVDGVPFGTATYGGSRPDVCTVYPGEPGCPNVGWNFTLNTNLLTNGSHTLEITATTSTGQRGTISSAFSIANSNNVPGRISIDQPTSNNNPFLGIAQFSGWALNDNAAVTAVSVTIDGIPYGAATYGLSRPDVCNVYPGRPGCPNVGWSFTLDTTQLIDGTHILGVTETAADGSYFTASVSFGVANLSATNPLHINIDYPNGQGTPIFGTVTVSGWALDDFGSVTGVAIAVDGIPSFDAAYGLTRPDVCSSFSGNNCPNVGWSATLDTTLFANGSHTVAATASTISGQSSTVTVTFNVAN
ncbi:MAG TPA: hypothetical protein VGL97_05080 [Bryobacteraceae bacterium]